MPTSPRARYKRCGVKRNPPVTALPCQPPLGKGAKGTGEADCHSQCAHWLRNDREFYMGCGGISGGRTGASAPTEMSEHLRRAACPHAAVMVQWLTGGGLRAARPTEAHFAVRRGGALPLPYAPQGSPLRSVTRSAVGRVVREADPYGGVVRRAAQIKGGPAGRPYGFYIHFLYLTSTFYMRFAENQSPRGRGLPV